LSKRSWDDLHGYPELDVRAIHVDALLCFMAHFGPASEQYLAKPKVIYHMEHERAEGDANARFSTGTIPTLSWHNEVYPWALDMAQASRPKIFNGDNWGLAEQDFNEDTLHE